MRASIKILGVAAALVTLGVSMNAFGFLGIGGTSWKEEVLLHDGSKIVVERSQTYGGRHEIGQSAPIKTQEIDFTVPGTRKSYSFKSEYSEDVGRANLLMLALHILNDTPYLITEPHLCPAYNKWGRPNPPYVIFKHDGREWRRIPLEELPAEFGAINLVVSTKNKEEKFRENGVLSVDMVKKLNKGLRQPEYQRILREPLPQPQINVKCMEMVPYKGSWVMPNDSAAKWVIDQQKQ